MSLFIIGDLHLSFSVDKPMAVFGPNWDNHPLKLKAYWDHHIKPEDTIILAGDTSWAINLDEAEMDLAWIDTLPGKKILLRGNHDYWWSTLKKMRKSHPTLDYLQNNAFEVEGFAIVGTRGWTVPVGQGPDLQEVKIFDRECQRLALSIASAPAHLEKICVLHFPPFDERGRKSQMNAIIEAHGIKRVYFGHIHTNHHMVRQGWIDGVHYQLISGDYLDFKPYKILPLEANQEDLKEVPTCPSSPLEA